MLLQNVPGTDAPGSHSQSEQEKEAYWKYEGFWRICKECLRETMLNTEWYRVYLLSRNARDDPPIEKYL